MKLRLLCLTAVALLTACSEKKAEPVHLDCRNPAVLQDIRTNLQQQITDQADQFATTDNRQLMDSDSIASAVNAVSLTLDNPKQDASPSPICQAVLNARVPHHILTTAAAYSPLLYGDVPLADAARQSSNGQVKFNGAGELAQIIRYTPENTPDGGFSVHYENDGFDPLTQTLTTLIMPYGVKSMLMLNGRLVSRETALYMQQHPEPVAPETNDTPASAAMLPETVSASDIASNLEMLTPSDSIITPPAAPVGASPQELSTARANNQAADNEIRQVWQSIDNSIREQLLDEQRSWIRDKNQSCRRAAAQSDSDSRAEYLRLQCDTRMTRERTQYLRDYAIP